jgi:ATP-dependent RNA helicase RhlE
MLFSATFDASLRRLMEDHMRNPKRLSVDTEAPAVTVAHALYPVSQTMKPELLLRVLKDLEVRSVLIFTRTKRRADRVSENLKRAGYVAAPLHANLNQNQRQQTLDKFRTKKLPILVATDIASRGLDIEHISHVINYDMPDSATSYTHRIGRTGRAAHTGDAFTLSTWEDQDTVRNIEKLLGAPIEKRILDGFPYDEPLPKELVAPKPMAMRHRNTTTWHRRLS